MEVRRHDLPGVVHLAQGRRLVGDHRSGDRLLLETNLILGVR